MPEGGQLILEAHRRPQRGAVELSIRDSGVGFPEELIDKPLQPFYTTKKGGAGLGLSIADGIIRSHRGRIDFKNLKDQGAEVSIELPIP